MKKTILLGLVFFLLVSTVSALDMSIELIKEEAFTLVDKTYESDYNEDGIPDVLTEIIILNDTTIQIDVGQTNVGGKGQNAYKWDINMQQESCSENNIFLYMLIHTMVPFNVL